MRQTIRIVSGAAIALLMFQHGCQDKGSNPMSSKNPREFTWTVDTLIAHPDAIQTNMWSIYATSPRNVYVAGHSDWAGVNGAGILWRYDGAKWYPVNWGFDGTFVSLESITGFGPSDIYAVGHKGPSGVVLHYDGTRWTHQTLLGNNLFSVRGSNPSDIWTGGWMGTVFHYDGTQWTKVKANQQMNFKDFAEINGKTYAIAYRVDEQPQDTVWNYFLSWNGQAWDTLNFYLDIAGGQLPRAFGVNLLNTINGDLYSAGGVIAKWVNGRWETLFPYGASVFGTSSANLFAIFDKVFHFDGTSWYEFQQLAPAGYRFWSGWTDGKEVFIVGNNGQRTLVLHGK